MFNLNFPVAAIFLITLFSIPAEAKIYKWVDDNGNTQYGEVIPPEYANKQKDSLDKAGLVEKRIEKESPESVRAKEQAEAKRKLENQATLEQKRRDNAILDTYSNESEIDMARDRSMVLINARIESSKTLLKTSQNTLDEHKKEFDSRTREGKKIPQSLTNDIALTETKINKYQTEINKSEEELAAVKLRFDNEKALYRKLKGGSSKK